MAGAQNFARIPAFFVAITAEDKGLREREGLLLRESKMRNFRILVEFLVVVYLVAPVS